MESKREEFRKYLEKGGALQALSYALSHLYEMPEKPLEPLLYIQECLKQCIEGGKLGEPTPPATSGSVDPSQTGTDGSSGATEESINAQ